HPCSPSSCLYATSTTETHTLPLHDALPISSGPSAHRWVTASAVSGSTSAQEPSGSMTRTPSVVSISRPCAASTTSRMTLPLTAQDRKSTRLNSSHVKISYAVFCLKKKTNRQ